MKQHSLQSTSPYPLDGTDIQKDTTKMTERSPSEIREQAIMCFKQMARPKYDKGQKEKGTNLDDHPDLVGAIREELVDGWFYLDSLAKQIDDKNSRIAELEFEVERWKEQAKR